MRYHDFYLEEYTVTKFGSEIVLKLIYDNPKAAVEQSAIRFSDVIAYHFVHTGRAVITGITVVPFPLLFSEYGEQIANWWEVNAGFPHWENEQAECIEALEQKGYSGWLIDSAIGFQGFVIARSAREDAGSS